MSTTNEIKIEAKHFSNVFYTNVTITASSEGPVRTVNLYGDQRIENYVNMVTAPRQKKSYINKILVWQLECELIGHPDDVYIQREQYCKSIGTTIESVTQDCKTLLQQLKEDKIECILLNNPSNDLLS